MVVEYEWSQNAGSIINKSVQYICRRFKFFKKIVFTKFRKEKLLLHILQSGLSCSIWRERKAGVEPGVPRLRGERVTVDVIKKMFIIIYSLFTFCFVCIFYCLHFLILRVQLFMFKNIEFFR